MRLFLLTLCLFFSASSGWAATDRYAIAPRQKVVDFEDLLIDQIYLSMVGPETSVDDVDFGLAFKDSRYIWITKYTVDVLDEENNPASQEFLCHSNLIVQGAPWAGGSMQYYNKPYFSISQGQKELALPKGFAINADNNPQLQFRLTGQLLNINYPEIHKKVHFRITIEYYDDAQAQELGLKPLDQKIAAVSCPVKEDFKFDESDEVCEPVAQMDKYAKVDDRMKRVGHWYVPPGRHTYRAPLNKDFLPKDDFRLHYIWMHLHPYGEFMELVDKTTGESVWKGYAETAKDYALLLKTDHYSSAKGIPIHIDHEYELVGHYNNTTNSKIDAMASVWMFMQTQ